MKKFIVYLLVIVLTVSLGFAIFYLVRDNEVISISSASIYKDAGDSFTLDVDHKNKKSYTEISVTSSDEDIVDGNFDKKNSQYKATAKKGGVARINVRTSNSRFRNLWCDVIVGDGTVESPYYIYTAEQLAAIGMGPEIKDENGQPIGVYAGSEGYEQYHSDLCYKLVANIDVSAVNNGYWVPLQNFTGRFDGNGHTISNIYIDAVGYKESLGDKADIRFNTNTNAGMFNTIGTGSVVYNFKLENYMAIGSYSSFGTIAAENYGTIERIEVKDAYLSIQTGVFGGIAGVNGSENPVRSIIKVDENGNEKEGYARDIAKLDRNSIRMILGQKTSVDASGKETISVLGATGTIGGVAGTNRGIITYCYARGDVYFGDTIITYGGIVGENTALSGLKYDEENFDESPFQGASIRDSYSDLRTTFIANPKIESVFGGAIGLNQDYRNGTVDVDDVLKDHKVNNYLIGIYYNKDNLNHAQEDITKDFAGIGKFLLDTDTVDFADKKMIVYGLTAEEMTDAENFVSHTTQELVFNEDGTSKGVVEKEVLWLFDSVWAINAEDNDGMPYLNYQLVYVPDNFNSVGIPVVTSALDDYYFKIEVVYPITILSGTDGKVRIRVGEYYQLVYSPTGLDMTWTSSDVEEEILTVDDQGKIYGVAPGTATVTVTTKAGSEASVTVIVENIPYEINAPKTIYLYQKEEFDLNQIEITPDPTGKDEVKYNVTDTNGNASSLVIVRNGVLIADDDTTGTARLKIEVADTVAEINVVVVEAPEVKLSGSSTNITAYLSDLERQNKLSDTITITNDKNEDLEYSYTFESGSGIVDLSWDPQNKNKLNYTVKGVGNATVRVDITTPIFEGKGSLYIYFNIKDDTTVTLTPSPEEVVGYFTTMQKTGSVTISNSAGTTLSYSVTSSDENIVTASVVSNSINYTIKNYGNATLTVKVETPHYKGTCYVYFKVLDPSTVTEYINLSQTSVSMYQGDTITLTASGTFFNLNWTSDNPSVASVDSNGKITGISVGTATIIARSDYAEARCIVYVEKRVETCTITISPATLTLNPGNTYNLRANGNYSSIQWASLNTNVVTVNSNGKVTAVANGSTSVVAAAKDSSGTVRAYDYCYITVVTPVTLSITRSTSTVYVNNSVTFTANVSNGGTVTWTGKSGPATFSESGNTITATATGTGTITVTASYGSASASSSATATTNSAYSPYIYNLDDLNKVRYNLDKDYYLAANINVGSWTPINNFTGSLSNLGSFTISNIQVASNANGGLFGKISGATITNIHVSNSSISGHYAGAIAGEASSSSFSGCTSTNNMLTANNCAGGIVGYMYSNSVAKSCTSTNNTISTTGSDSFSGGIAGYANSASVISCTVSGGKAQISSGANGYAGGVVGYLNASKVTSALVYNSMSIIANSTTNNYAGGICGYTNDSASGQTISSSTVRGVTISGYHAGGIGGAMNSSKNVTVSFDEIKSGFRSEDTTTLSYTVGVQSTAVKNNVTVSGVRVGGLFGELRAGVVQNCYTRAKLQGNSGSSEKGGFAASIHAEGHFNNNGGSGKVGLVRYCYSACTFGGSGKNYSITQSLVHNYASIGSGANRAGYCMDYLFDDGLDGSATYYDGSNIFSSDKVKAKKSSSEMQTSSTYTAKGFSSSTWNLSSYPTLKTER